MLIIFLSWKFNNFNGHSSRDCLVQNDSIKSYIPDAYVPDAYIIQNISFNKHTRDESINDIPKKLYLLNGVNL